MADLDGMTLEKFRMWSLSALRSFLALRKKSTEGSFDDLSARAFITWEEQIPVNMHAEHAERQLLNEYKAKLVCGGEVLPDPYSLKSWLDECAGCEMWPPIYITDISEYLSSNTPQELVHQLLNEYKVGKGFRYHTSQWVKTIYYHPITNDSPICFLKANVTPSMSINAHPYEVWIATEKTSEQVPGGHILSAYCTCTAGMLGTCNHIAGVLFRLEEAAVRGRNQQSVSVTSLPCGWITPSTKTSIKETDVEKLSWTKDHYTRQIKHPALSAVNQCKKKTFQPFKETDPSSGDIKNKLKDIAMRHAPDSRYLNILQKKRNVTQPKTTLPSIREVAADFNSNQDISNMDVNDITSLRKQFIEKINLSDDEILDLKHSTIDQSNSDLWSEQRKGRITASNFYRVKTRVQTLEQQPDADPTAIVSTIMGYERKGKTRPSLVEPSLKHGLSCEPHAKRAYTLIMKHKHRKFKSSNAGLSIMPCKQYIAASPDLETECACCGKGLCEIKCPYKIRAEVPTVDNVDYLKTLNEAITLKENTSYYYQVQGQMAVSGRTFCDLFVFTFHGSILCRIAFNKTLWEETLNHLELFWSKYIFHELMTGEVRKKFLSQEQAAMTSSYTQKFDNTASTSTVSAFHPAVYQRFTPVGKTSRSVVKRGKCERKPHHPICLCRICSQLCSDDPSSFDENSIQCDNCKMWTHFKCANIQEGYIPAKEDVWCCSKCVL